MNFFPNNMMPIPEMNQNGNMMIPIPGMNLNPNMDFNNDILNKTLEFESRLKKLEQRVIRLENEYGNDFNYSEPDNSLYMI